MRILVVFVLVGSLAVQSSYGIGNGDRYRDMDMAKAIEVEEPYPYPDIPFPQVVWGSQALANPAIQEQTRIGDPHSEATLRSQESSLRELASPVQEERPERHSPADRSS